MVTPLRVDLPVWDVFCWRYIVSRIMLDLFRLIPVRGKKLSSYFRGRHHNILCDERVEVHKYGFCISV